MVDPKDTCLLSVAGKGRQKIKASGRNRKQVQQTQTTVCLSMFFCVTSPYFLGVSQDSRQDVLGAFPLQPIQAGSLGSRGAMKCHFLLRLAEPAPLGRWFFSSPLWRHYRVLGEISFRLLFTLDSGEGSAWRTRRPDLT